MDEQRREWERDGYLVLREAVARETLDAYAGELAAARDGLLVRAPGDEHVSLATQHAEGAAAGVIDPYAISGAARDALLAPAVLAALRAAWDDTPLLFDAAEAQAGAPDDGPYRDATFTALADEPQTLVTVAVALGDGAGVVLFPGSASVETAPFSGRYRHFNVERDGEAALARHRDELRAALPEASDTITLNAGDVVLWAAGLVHLPVTGAALVGHLCPSRVAPGWFAYRPERATHAAAAGGAAWVASQHYDLVDAIAPPETEPAATVPEVEDREELERVEDALREHDQDLAYEPGPAPAPSTQDDAPDTGRPRSGGLVDSVRGMLGRRGRR